MIGLVANAVEVDMHTIDDHEVCISGFALCD